jgi:hypothetical protein
VKVGLEFVKSILCDGSGSNFDGGLALVWKVSERVLREDVETFPPWKFGN